LSDEDLDQRREFRKKRYNLRSMPGHIYNSLFDLATEQYGYVTAEEAVELGVYKSRLPEMATRGVVERVDRGLYRFPAVPRTRLDQYMEAVLWPHRARGVISHASALDLHDMCDVNPAHIDVTVPRGYRVTRRPPQIYRLHHRDLRAEEIARHEGIPVVTPRRAIMDAIEAHLGQGLIRQAIETARGRGSITRKEVLELEHVMAG
jgi:predicted transcriptional regulator of viral defense system